MIYDALVGYLFLVSSASSFLLSKVLDLKLCLFLTLKKQLFRCLDCQGDGEYTFDTCMFWVIIH